MELHTWLAKNYPSTDIEVKSPVQVDPNTWREIRVFLSSSFIDTHAERDVIIKRVIPSINRRFASRFIRLTPVDLRWGVLKEESKDCETIQKTCLNQVDQCRQETGERPWFIGLRTERYGWVQNKLMRSEGFEHPELCKWIDKFAECSKNVSITSLECIHAALPPTIRPNAPTVFFYKRHITNPLEIEKELRWILDFEYVPKDTKLEADVQYQYTKTDDADTYAGDKESLDKYLQSQDNVKYSTYECLYQKGGARVTAKHGHKSFGVAYVSGLEEFEKQVERDLSDAIESNFKTTDVSDTPKHIQVNILHENAVKEKASTFVGRAELFQTCYQYCATKHQQEEKGDDDAEEEVKKKDDGVEEKVKKKDVDVEEEVERRRLNQEEKSVPKALTCLADMLCQLTFDITDCIQKNIPNENIENYTPGCASTEIGSSVMIIHGDPGRGKSAVMAAVSTKCLKDLRASGEFVFVHTVGSCPGSNNLELMLRRLYVNLRKYRIDLGETDLPKGPKSIADLKNEHVKFLEESARKHSDKGFIILIDAVNQFHDHFLAWRMWWLPSKGAPRNLRVVISTLNQENGTFENACKTCPNAVKVPVQNMSYEDGQEMVSTILLRFNKKLTTIDDEHLGNQMRNLLTKNLSPLYLTAATQALRRFGIYENVREYITSLPVTIPALFTFLLDNWSKEYGEDFIRDVTCIICLSKDGVLENEINDILSFKEQKKCVDYQCSFSRLFDSLSEFLAAGGGGYLRFFHDQVNKVVRDKYFATNPRFEQELHGWLVDFYLSHIRPQLCEAPKTHPPAYYEHCLLQVVNHQLKSTWTNEDTVDYKDTLRNIYFLRELFKHHQENLLQQAYINAIRQCKDDTEQKVLKQWAKFTQLYASRIKEYPEWAHNMAVNQHRTSHVVTDTSKHLEPAASDGYPLYWCNTPSAEDAVLLKYTSGKCDSCVASRPERNLCCLGGHETNRAYIYEYDTGVLIHQVETSNVEPSPSHVRSIYLSSKLNTFMIGDMNGYLSVRSADSGVEMWSEKVCNSTADYGVRWIGSVGEYVACGTSSTISIIDEEKQMVINSWLTELESCCYGFQSNFIISGHGGVIKYWTVNGRLMKSIAVGGGRVLSLSIHPTREDVIAFVLYHRESDSCSIKQMNVSTEEEICTIPDIYYKSVVLYDNSGGRIFTVSNNKTTIMVYGEDGNLQNKLKGHTKSIYNMCFVAGTNDLLTAAKDGSMLFTVPTTPDPVDEESEEEVIRWCDLLPGGEEFVTLNAKDKIQVWSVSSCGRSRSVHIEGVIGAAVHPGGNHIVVCTREHLCLLNTDNMETVATCNKDKKEHVKLKVSPNGTKCVVVPMYVGSAKVFDITNGDEINGWDIRFNGVTMGVRKNAFDIHHDNEQVVSSGGGGYILWSITTGQEIRTVRRKDSICIFNINFIYNPDGVVYSDMRGRVHITDMTGGHLFTFDSVTYQGLTLIRNGTHLITAEIDHSIRFHDIRTGKLLYRFFDHLSTGFNCFLDIPAKNMLLAYNKNGRAYVLKNSRD